MTANLRYSLRTRHTRVHIYGCPNKIGITHSLIKQFKARLVKHTVTGSFNTTQTHIQCP